MSKLDKISKLTSNMKIYVSILNDADAKAGGLKANIFYPAEVKLWKKEYGENHAAALIVDGNNEYYFSDLADFNRKFNLQTRLIGGRKSRKNRRKSKKNLRKSNRRRYR